MKIENWLLGALLQSGYDHLLAHLEPVSLSYAQTLYEPDEPIQFVYFPNDAVVSLLSLTRDGETIEVGMIGYEGMMDIAVVLGADAIPYRAYVQIPGSGLRMKTEVIRSEFGQVGRLHDLLLRYTHLRITQISQSAVCNRFHPVEQRLCRWLLVAQDRVRSDEIQLTQEVMARMLGVRRASVTEAAGNLQKAGLIQYTRGQITILDRRGLEAATCECFAIVKHVLDWFLAT